MKRGREDGAQSNASKRPTSVAQRNPPVLPPMALNQGRLTTNDALGYLREVKNRFSDRKEVYDTFLEIMKDFKIQRIDTSGVIARVKDLFRGHRELILGFNTFLPKGYEIELARISDDEDEVGVTSTPGQVQPSQPAAANQPERPATGPNPSASNNANNNLKAPVEFDQAITYVNKIKTRFASDERIYKTFLEILNMYRKNLKTINNVYEEVAVLFRNHQDLLDEFTYFLPDNTPPPLAPPGGQRRPMRPGQTRPGVQKFVVPGTGLGSNAGTGMGATYSLQQDMRALNKRKAAKKAEEGFKRQTDEEDNKAGARLPNQYQFFDKVKARLRNRDAYQDFLKCLNLFTQDIISKPELVVLMHEMIGRYPELMGAFMDFMNKIEQVPMDELENRIGSRDIPRPYRDMSRIRQPPNQKDKYLLKPLSEIVMTETERCTPSYVKIPSSYPKLQCSGKTALGESVLNDLLVNVTSGSEDYSFKLMRKNQYEEALFRCEDDRFDLDTIIDQNASALRHLRPIADKIMAMSSDEKANFRLDEDALWPIHYRSIEKIYGDQGINIVDLVKKNPTVAIPVVLMRLDQKDREWRQVKNDMTKLWRKVYESNYQKSLDHRSFYFKQSDKKSLAPRAMMQEIREVNEKRKHDEQFLRSLSAAYRSEALAQADLVYDYSHRQVHQDCYRVIKTAIEEMVSPDDAKEQIVDLWMQLVEPFFELAPRGDDTKGEAGVETSGRRKGKGRSARASSPTDAKSESSEQDDNADATSADNGVSTKNSRERRQRSGLGEVTETSTDVTGEGRRKRDALTDAADESMDDNTGRTYDSCKPLAPYTGSNNKRGKDQRSINVLFGNEQLYFFFRYHRYLYDRLWQARKCCVQKNQPQFRQTGEPETVLTAQMEAQQREEADRLHVEFMDMVMSLLEGGLESGAYEDQCRSLLGNNSYVLFTLDKLVQKFVKHMQTMVQDDQTLKLLQLYKYENARTLEVKDSVYMVNCANLMSEEPCFKIQYHPKEQQLSIQIVDLDALDTPPNTEGCANEYVRELVNTSAAPSSTQLYLGRNLPSRAKQFVDACLVDELDKVHILNGLECKISANNSKVSYVLDTEDIMCRKNLKHKPMDATRADKSEKFQKWLSRHSSASVSQDDIMGAGPMGKQS